MVQGLLISIRFASSGAQGQLIAVDAEFDGVAHRGELDERNLRAGNDAHIQKMLSECAFAAYGMNDGTLTGLRESRVIE